MKSRRSFCAKNAHPHDISAVYLGDRADDTCEGSLDEPDTHARRRKDPLIIPCTEYAWTDTLTAGSNKEEHCQAQKNEPNYDPVKKNQYSANALFLNHED